MLSGFGSLWSSQTRSVSSVSVTEDTDPVKEDDIAHDEVKVKKDQAPVKVDASEEEDSEEEEASEDVDAKKSASKQGPTLEQLEESMKQLQAQIEKAKRRRAEAAAESKNGKRKKSLKVVATAPASLLSAPKRGLVTTQRAALYSATTKANEDNKV